ncbi:YdcF family protein [Caballeronia sp. GAWG2-1]|uniref:YdcF family protein n=1 Tax=Caballeronia sp. GAWG2-1 TaxID=2921744 RepID=UPI0020279576|nr:YdcF family protein [Caballeronia sp. GAWG2-1]
MDLLCLLLVFVALFIVWRKRRLVIFLVAGTVFWLFGSWLAGPMISLAQIGYGSKQAPRLADRTAIIVLGGGTEYDRNKHLVPLADSIYRVDLAAALYKTCVETDKQCQVIMSGGNPQHHEQTEAQLYGGLLVDRGVKPADLILEDQSLDTYENARNTYKILRSRQYDTTILITSSLHMRRALLAFDAFDLHPQPAVAFVRNPKSWLVPHPEGWIDSDSGLHEMLGTLKFYVWRWLGLY